MQMQYFKQYSPALNRDMECKVYGHAGRPVLFIPCQDGRFFDFENFNMADTWSPWIESGQVMVFAIDTIDQETWSNKGGDPYWRIRRHESWISYIVYEMVPFMQAMARPPVTAAPMATSMATFSLGAHSAYISSYFAAFSVISVEGVPG